MVEKAMMREPYKFLDFYDRGDRDLFFGRRRETELLVADIVVARLVVLFARTGTGKSSLLNAAVRPRLEELGFDTVLTRVGGDPAASALQALGAPTTGSFAEIVTNLVEERKKPLALFFDQFEEFFHGHAAAEVTKRFIKDIGALYRNKQSGVHVVFSLREDYLAEMDRFRDEIPTIFQKESQLRLRQFTRDGAREVIAGPTTVVLPPFSFDEGLVEAIVDDIAKEDDLVSPVALQIVCDTLWREREGDRITQQQYRRSGGAGGILKHRFIKDIGRLPADDLLTLERVYPEMSTEDSRTKRTRTVSELASTEPEALALRQLVGALRDLKLARVNGDAFEWVSDFLSELSKALRSTLQLLWLGKRMVQTNTPIDDGRFVTLFSNEELLGYLNGPLWYFLLRTAARSRDALGLWYGKAMQHNAAPGGLLRRALDDTTFTQGDALRVIQYFGEMGFVDELAQLLRGDADRARAALRALGASGRAEAVEVIRSALDRNDVQAAAIDALRAIATKEAMETADAVAKHGRSWREVLFGRRPGVLRGMSDEEWSDLRHRSARGTGIVLIGDSAVADDPELADSIAKEVGYPFRDRRLRVIVDYLSTVRGQPDLKLWDFERETRPTKSHRLLAAAPFRVYVTTAVSRALETALRLEGREPQSRNIEAVSEVNNNNLAERPLVVHLYSEKEVGMHPRSAIEAFAAEWFLQADVFVALGSSEGEFLFEIARSYANHVLVPLYAIIPPPELTNERYAEERARDFFRQTAELWNIHYFFGTPEDFLTELLKRAI